MTDEKKDNVVPITKAAEIMANAAKASDTAPQPMVEVVNVETIDQFVAFTAEWHQRKLNRLKHMAAVPSDGSIQMDISEDDGTGKPKKIVLVGDVHEAFVFGLKIAISEFKELPFTYTEEAAPAGNEEPTNPDTAAPTTDG